MTEGKLIIRNVRKNIQDYMIYFLTLTVSVSMFYAFNSFSLFPFLTMYKSLIPFSCVLRGTDLHTFFHKCAEKDNRLFCIDFSDCYDF